MSVKRLFAPVFALLFFLPAVAEAGEHAISGDQYIGCVDRDYFEKLSEFATQQDTEALTAGLLAGTCTIFERGERVYLSDTAIFSGLVQVRRAGEVAEYWTNTEAISR